MCIHNVPIDCTQVLRLAKEAWERWYMVFYLRLGLISYEIISYTELSYKLYTLAVVADSMCHYLTQ